MKRCEECGRFASDLREDMCPRCKETHDVFLDEVEDVIIADWEWLRQNPRG